MSAPINVFRSVSRDLTDNVIAFDAGPTLVYTAPVNNTAIVLMAQIANTSSDTITVTFALADQNDGVSPLVQEFAVPPGDALDTLSGKLVASETQQLHARIHGAGSARITVSVLESRNA